MARRLLDEYPCIEMFDIVRWGLVPYQTSVRRTESGGSSTATESGIHG